MQSVFGPTESSQSQDLTTSKNNPPIKGDCGNDTLYGSNGDTLYGNGGDDLFLVSGSPSTDRFTIAYGGAGNDTFQSSGPTDNFALQLDGGSGNDSFVFDTVDAPTMRGGSGNDNFSIRFLSTGLLDGQSGNDVIDAAISDGVIHGGTGADVINVNFGKGTDLYGDAGNDTVSLGSGEGRIYGGDGQDYISASNNSYQGVTLDGGNGDDVIVSSGSFGGRHGNFMYGGAGRDTIESAASGNTITGGAGADHFVYGDSVNIGSEVPDVITDFSVAGRDVLDLSRLLEKYDVSGNPFQGGYLSFDVTGGSTSVLFDPNGGGGDYHKLAVLEGTVLTSRDTKNFIT